jgi:hypothetical protein
MYIYIYIYIYIHVYVYIYVCVNESVRECTCKRAVRHLWPDHVYACMCLYVACTNVTEVNLCVCAFRCRYLLTIVCSCVCFEFEFAHNDASCAVVKDRVAHAI